MTYIGVPFEEATHSRSRDSYGANKGAQVTDSMFKFS